MRPTLLTPIVLAALASVACGQDGSQPAKPEGAPVNGDAKDGDWTKTASGLQYQVLVPGKGGKSPRMGDRVKVSYKGWRDDGFVFDESSRHGGPATFTVGQLVDGWNEALQLMTVGAKWKLRVPPELGYGKQGMGKDIPPDTTLNFELELHSAEFLPDMPVFTKPDAAAQKTADGGLKYEVLAEGKGDTPKSEDPIELRFALFNPNGKLLDCSEKAGAVKARVCDLSLPFFKTALALMKPGSKLRLEVPPELAFGASPKGADLPPNSVTYWTLELVQILTPLPVPAFDAIDESKMKKTASGLLYEVIKDGEGTNPKMGQTVKVHYAGWNTDGSLFDSSFPRGEPSSFVLGQVIPGWNEGVQLMKPGAVFRFVIPSNLAYGARGAGEKIKPNATLVFRIELISVE